MENVFEDFLEDDLEVLDLVEFGMPRSMDPLSFYKRFRLYKETVYHILVQIEHQLEYPHNRTPFLCTICGNNFVSKSSINRNMKKIHKEFQSTKVPHLQCPEPMCGEKTLTYLEL